ncbi:MAG: dienelactone hydrolase family protein [Armatimonadetes bacterium]|nr:dienelactone hydrolase family protein [Armatimonadota bacterium]
MTEETAAVSRRTLLATGLFTGFALAVQPVAEGAITTDTAGMVASEVKIKAADGVAVPAYQAHPARGTNLPVVIVVQEIFGVHEHIKDVCHRFAKLGYFVIAPELFYRQGDVSKIADIGKVISEVVNEVPDTQVMSDLDDTVAHAKATGLADTAKLAITGFCWGGRIVWLYAAHNPKLKAGAAWYGGLAKGRSEVASTAAVSIAPTLTVPVLGLYGAQDNGIPQTDVEAMRTALDAGKSGSKIIVYPDAGHGFHADYRPSYKEDDAKDAFAKLLEWFKDNGV